MWIFWQALKFEICVVFLWLHFYWLLSSSSKLAGQVHFKCATVLQWVWITINSWCSREPGKVSDVLVHLQPTTWPLGDEKTRLPCQAVRHNLESDDRVELRRSATPPPKEYLKAGLKECIGWTDEWTSVNMWISAKKPSKGDAHNIQLSGPFSPCGAMEQSVRMYCI